MKRLLFVILLGCAAVARGQGKIDWQPITACKYSTLYLKPDSNMAWWMYNSYGQKIVVPMYKRWSFINIDSLMSLWDKYRAECYADSMNDAIDPGIYPGHKIKISIWEHRQPTLNGFMEFLRKKTGK